MKKRHLLFVQSSRLALVVFLLIGFSAPAYAQAFLGLQFGPLRLELGNQPIRRYVYVPYADQQPYVDQDPCGGNSDYNGYEDPCYVAPQITVVYWYDSYKDLYYYL